jgi:predicted NACHT family NTPase
MSSSSSKTGEIACRAPAAAAPRDSAWAGGAGSRLWVLLGDYGTGKTAFTRRFAYDLAQRALGDAATRLCRC